jgi:hypothetical protein
MVKTKGDRLRQVRDPTLNAVFGCTEFDLGIELGKDSKSKMEMNWTKIPNLLFGCA